MIFIVVGCSPTAALNFNNGIIENQTPKYVSIVADGVSAADRNAYLNGSTDMNFEYFKGFDVHKNILIKFRFKADKNFYSDFPPTLVANCVYGNKDVEPSIGITLTAKEDNITFLIRTTEHQDFAFIKFPINVSRRNILP